MRPPSLSAQRKNAIVHGSQKCSKKDGGLPHFISPAKAYECTLYFGQLVKPFHKNVLAIAKAICTSFNCHTHTRVGQIWKRIEAFPTLRLRTDRGGTGSASPTTPHQQASQVCTPPAALNGSRRHGRSVMSPRHGHLHWFAASHGSRRYGPRGSLRKRSRNSW